jgi:PAS domain S-box-containing protein
VDAETCTIVEANPAALNLIGAARERVIGQVCHTYLCPTEVDRCPIRDLGKESDNGERVLLTANGDTVPVLKTATPVMLGGRRQLLECFVDIRDRKRAEEQLQRNVAELERFNMLAVGREEGITELKRQANQMAREAGQAPPDDLSFVKPGPTAVARDTACAANTGGGQKGAAGGPPGAGPNVGGRP